MRVVVKVKPGSKNEAVTRLDETHFLVAVTERPQEGKANQALCKALADYFGVAPSRVGIVSGMASREKIVDIAL